uniref:C3H1-type domain-containing protein n=1 Tax=Chromera velia CCMP2878 TaxID=1169474 RepID=A0A0G4F2N3_9ALVE|eukprot:Cvel_14828.t1-p1 / transcript=Cvel_14828.t1 / gene=Cvel_14828 / organism=Chromera_velia_CCMP2878 / gene_product=hypothetical protein / transcript_product=hypothetical protein / location=Cvel_scaffold1070:43078-45836(-) / protein_length=415 / sequence_SO=supercontig / SO=protein_coding / is_pseudo=false
MAEDNNYGFLHKTKICRHFLVGKCRMGPNCRFAHDAAELKDNPDLRYTSLCFSIAKGLPCKRGNLCTYAHSESELQQACDRLGEINPDLLKRNARITAEREGRLAPRDSVEASSSTHEEAEAGETIKKDPYRGPTESLGASPTSISSPNSAAAVGVFSSSSSSQGRQTAVLDSSHSAEPSPPPATAEGEGARLSSASAASGDHSAAVPRSKEGPLTPKLLPFQTIEPPPHRGTPLFSGVLPRQFSADPTTEGGAEREKSHQILPMSPSAGAVESLLKAATAENRNGRPVSASVSWMEYGRGGPAPSDETVPPSSAHHSRNSVRHAKSHRVERKDGRNDGEGQQPQSLRHAGRPEALHRCSSSRRSSLPPHWQSLVGPILFVPPGMDLENRNADRVGAALYCAFAEQQQSMRRGER